MTRPALEQFDNGVGNSPSGLQYDSVSRDMRDFQSIQMRYQGSAGADKVLHKVSLTDGGAEMLSDAMRDEQIRNAKEHFEALRRKAGAIGPGRDGLQYDHLTKLADDPSLSRGERDAALFLKSNYEELKTGWPGGRITAASIDKFKGDAKTTVTDAPHANPDEAERLIREGRRKTDGPGRARDGRPDDVIVERNDGWERIAEKSLRNQGVRKYDRKTLYDEIDRLHRLNPHKIKMVHEGDRIKTR
jgi:hypothetical protein